MKLLSKISASTALLSLLVAQMSQGAFAKASDEDKKITFQKFFKEGVKDNAKFETIIDFPISASHATILREYSDSDSVMLPSEGCNNVSFKGLMNSLEKFKLEGKALFPPTFPGENGYWEELRKVAYAVGQLKKFEEDRGKSMKDPLPHVMPRITHLWNGKFNIIDVANAVRAEFPGVFHRQLITEWLDADSLKRDSTLFQTPNNIDFLRFEIMLSDLTGHAIRLVGPCDFSLKWHVGRPRPEEIIYKILDKKDPLQLPNYFAKMKVFQDLEEKHLKSATDFTAYEGEGSPNHPSYPAMHSASSSGSFWLDVTMNLTKEQLCEARMLDWSISYGRTVAGVHYESDNIAGLMVGQEIIAQKLPQYLHDEYGADFDAVKDAVDKARFDWTTFTATDCWTDYKKFRTISKGETVKAGHEEL